MHYGEITADMNLSIFGPIPLLNHSALQDAVAMEVQHPAPTGVQCGWLADPGTQGVPGSGDILFLVAVSQDLLDSTKMNKNIFLSLQNSKIDL